MSTKITSTSLSNVNNGSDTNIEHTLIIVDALSSRKSDNDIIALINQYPHSVQQQNSLGFYPLHIAFIYEYSVELILLLITTFPHAATARFSWNFTLRNHDAIMTEFINQLCIEKMLWECRNMQIDTDGWYPIHFACSDKKYESVALELIDLIPKVAETRTIRNLYPLHLACKYDLSNKVVSKLISTFPKALQMQDTHGRTPLNEACTRQHSDKGVFFNLAESYPQAIQVPDMYGNYPIHWACFSGQPTDVLLKLIHSFPQALYMKGGYLHVLYEACKNDLNAEVIFKLLLAYPQETQKKRTVSDVRYPLHVACYYCQSEAVILCILNENLKAVKRKDFQNNLPWTWLGKGIECNHQHSLMF
jgi:ankyrin repeat protein